MSSTAKARIPELDGLRGVAILLVIGCHYEKFASLFGGLLQFGWIGVDIFFALSGFLITNILLSSDSNEHPIKRFYRRRARRILPPYLLTISAITIACVALGDRSVVSLQAIVKDVFFLQAFGWLPVLIERLGHPLLGLSFSRDMPTAPRGLLPTMISSFGPLWSLSIEEYFYLLWAPLVVFFSRSTVLTVAAGICGIEFCMRWFGFIGVPSYFTIFHRFDALAYGALAALLSARATHGTRRGMIIALSGSLIVLSGVLAVIWPIAGLEIRSSQVFMVVGVSAISIAAASGVALIAGSTGSRILVPLRFKPLQFLGRISYMLYLIHAFVYVSILQLLPVAWWSTVLSFGLAVALSTLSWELMEKRLLDRKEAVPLREGRMPGIVPIAEFNAIESIPFTDREG